MGGFTYYVDPLGNNQNPGTRELPWATPAYGARQLQPGDTMIICGGQYILADFGEDMIIPNSGQEDAWITIKGEDGNRPVLVGVNNLYAAFVISDTSYLRIENLEITSNRQEPFREGINAGGPIAHIILDNLYIHHLDEMGIDLRDVEQLAITNCIIEYCGFGSIGGPRGELGGWRNVLIQNCSLSYGGHYYQGGPGPSPYERPDGLGIEPSAGPLEVADTVVEHNRGDGLDSKTENTYIHHCVVASNSCDGIKLWGDNSKVENCLIFNIGDSDTAPTPWAGIVIDNIEKAGSSFEIINTTLAYDPRERGYPMYVQYSSGVPILLTMKNSTVSYGPGVVFIGSDVTFVCEYNLFYRQESDIIIEVGGISYTAEEVEAGALGPGNLARDPKFVQVGSLYSSGYKLQPDSPAIDAGTSEGAPTDDLWHQPRPYGSAWDISAYEWRPEHEEPPVVTGTDPIDGASGVTVDSIITVIFSKDIQAGDLYGDISLVDSIGYFHPIIKNISGTILTIQPMQNLDYETLYSITVPAGSVEDLQGNMLEERCFFSFTTEVETIPLRVVDVDPVDGAEQVVPDKLASVVFNKPVQPGSFFESIEICDASANPFPLKKAVEGSILTLSPVVDLNYSTSYEINVPADSVQDMEGIPLAEAFKSVFKTMWDTIPPTISLIDPGLDAVSVPANTIISIPFDENIQPGVTFSEIAVKDNSGKSVSVTCSIKRNKVIIQPSIWLAYLTKYTVTVPPGAVQDLAGNILNSQFAFNFITEKKPDTDPPQVVSTNPQNGAIRVYRRKTITLIFNETIFSGDAYNSITLTTNSGKTVSVTLSIYETILTIVPRTTLASRTRYTVTVPARAVKDGAGNHLTTAYVFGFTTA